ncbi:DUF551 domain-containing protein [Citrobacter freundii]|uniref:DUF551 domain-containing protein n=1 Tax=Citrobacter freundii TaxID=546 RepID=UPI00374EEFA1
MTTNNHPAHGPVSLERLHQISEILSKAAAQSDGGNLGYAMADAVKVIDGAIAVFGAEPVAWVRYCSDGTIDGPLLNYQIDDCRKSTWTPLYAAPQLPQLLQSAPGVPDELLSAMEEVLRISDRDHEAWHKARNGIASCRTAMLQAGNSPATTDGWIPVSERMPEGMKTVITSNGFDIGQGWWDGECWKSFDCHDVVPGKVTHWMPLPAAPQQEVK